MPSMFKLTELLRSKNKKTLSNLGNFIFKACQLRQKNGLCYGNEHITPRNHIVELCYIVYTISPVTICIMSEC